MQLSLKPLSDTMGHSPASETRGGRWFGFTGWGKARSRKPGVAPCGNPKCLQSLKLDSLVFNPVLVFERELTDKWFFFLVELSEYTYFKSVVWCSGILQLYAKGKETCLEMHYPRDTETAFDRLLFLLTPGKRRDLAPCKSHSGLLSQMLYTGISRRLLLFLCGLNRSLASSLWPHALECQQRLAVIARKCTVCQIIV